MSASLKSIRPLVGRSKPAVQRRSVVLPQPEGPSSVKNSPLLMDRSTPPKAWNEPNFFTTFSIVTDTACASSLRS